MTIALARRGLLGAAAGGLLLRPGVCEGKLAKGMKQAPYFYRFRLGDAECTVVTDGQLPLGKPEGAFLNIGPDEINRQLRDNFLPTDDAVLEQNILVVNFGERVVLFDTGMGTDALFGKTTGQLVRSLRAAGIEPGDVDAVVMSHAHIDHCGGLVGVDGKPNFPNAQYYINQADFDYWTSDAAVPANYPARANFLAQARNNLLPLRDRISFVRHEQEFLPGVTALLAPGHTVGHTIFMVQSLTQSLCYIGDLAHHPVLLLERPRTEFAFDTDAKQSAESRVRYMSMFAANRTPVLAYHFAWPGIGHVAKQGDGFRYVAESMDLEGVAKLNTL